LPSCLCTQKQKLDQCSADVRACREDVRTSSAQLNNNIIYLQPRCRLNSKVDALQEGLGAVLRILGQRTPHQSTIATASEGPCKRARVEAAAAAAPSPLDNTEIFGSVFSYVGFGEYFYVAAVCRKWRGAYISLCHKWAKATEKHKHKLRTKCSAIIVTAARLQLAINNGAEVAQLKPCARDWPYARRLGQSVVWWSLEPVAVLTLLRVYGYAWESSLYSSAAIHEMLELMQWLHQVKCPMPELSDVAYDCSGSSSAISLSILQWLHVVQPEWFNQLHKGAGGLDNKAWLLGIAAENTLLVCSGCGVS
jgi:hypothetical protein